MNALGPSRYREAYERWHADPAGFWAEAARRDRLDQARPDTVFDADGRDLRPLVRRRALQYLPQRRRPPCGGGPRRAGGDRLRQPRHGHAAHADLCGAAARDRRPRRRPAGSRRRQGRSGHPVHADDPRGGDRHAGLRPHRRHPFRRLRRLCAEGARDPHRRCRAQDHPVGVVRHRAEPGRAVQAAARRGDRALAREARCLPDPAAAAGGGRSRRRPRPRLAGHGGGREGRRQGRRLRAGRRHRSALHPLHVGHDRAAERRRARQRRPYGGPEMVDEEPLRARSRRGVLDRLRCRLGGRPFLYRLRAAAARLHEYPLRGQAGRARRMPAPSGGSSPSTAP